jgi:general secretion pathway protein D
MKQASLGSILLTLAVAQSCWAQATTNQAASGQAASGQAAVAMPVQTQATPSAPAGTSPAPSATDASNAAQPAADPKKKKESVVLTGKPVKANALRDQRKAAKLYLKGVKLLKKQQPEAAWQSLKEAAALAPANGTYEAAAEVARQSAVTRLVEQSTSPRVSQSKAADGTGESAKILQHALSIDPNSETALAHLNQLADETTDTAVGTSVAASMGVQTPLEKGEIAPEQIRIDPRKEKHSFHLKSNQRQVVIDVFHAYGIEASMHESVQSKPVRIDIDDATFTEAAHVVALLTNTFYEPLDPHRVIVATDTKANRTEFQRNDMETLYLPGLTEKELTDVSNLARNVFDAQQSVAEPSKSTITIRAPTRSLDAFNSTVTQISNGRPQVDLNIKIIQLAHTSERETGTKFFQQTGVYNVLSEVTSVLSQNQSLVQQIIASGLVPNESTLANQIEILAILVASGQLTGTPFNQGFLPFGGGLTQSILTPGPASLALSLNASDTRTLDDLHMHLTDDEAGTFKTGMRYPIETSSYSSAALPAIAGISSAALASATQTVPQIQYEDLGLTVKATPRVLRSNDVTVTLDLKIESLGGSALNNIPILNSQQFTGVLSLRAGETAVLLSDLSKQESRALSGLPGISDIPGLQDVSDITRDRNVARLLILVTPNVVRDTVHRWHGPMLTLEKSSSRAGGSQ